MKHTPGPWNATIYTGAFDQPLITSDASIIARLNSHSNRQHEANAKLIAEAPLMLEILQELVKDHEAEDRDINKEFDTYWNAKQLIQKLES